MSLSKGHTHGWRAMYETNSPRLFRPANKVSRSVRPVCDLVYYYAINHSQ